MTNVRNAESQAIMARTARRSKSVVERHAAQHPAIAACGLTLAPIADALLAAQDRLDAARTARRKALVARNEQATRVRNAVRSWVAEELSAGSAGEAEESDEPSGSHRIPTDPQSPPRAVNG